MFVPVVAQAAEIPIGSLYLRTGFVVLSFMVASCFPLAVYHSGMRSGVGDRKAYRQTVTAIGGSALWLLVTFSAALAGVLRFNPAPPTIVVVLLATLALAIGITRSALGKRIATQIPLVWLIGFQGFRVAVELLLHRAYVEGLMPVQMSYSGRNFDIVTGVTALLMAGWMLSGGRPSPRLILAWNSLGVALLLNVLIVAMLSAPLPFRVFMNEPSNIWITKAPWVWLPAVLVLAALTGHLLVYRKLAETGD